MGVTYTQALLASLVVTAVAGRLPAHYLPISGFTTTFFSVSFVLLSALSIWRVFLWPFYFSPLRRLPEPKVQAPPCRRILLTSRTRTDLYSMANCTPSLAKRRELR